MLDGQLDVVTKMISRVGFPSAVVLILLLQVQPRIDRGIQIADEVNGKLQYMVYSCQTTPKPQPSP